MLYVMGRDRPSVAPKKILFGKVRPLEIRHDDSETLCGDFEIEMGLINASYPLLETEEPRRRVDNAIIQLFVAWGVNCIPNTKCGFIIANT